MSSSSSNEELLASLISGEEARAESAALELAQRGASILLQLEPLLHSKNSDERWWAVRTFAQMSEPHLDWFVQALADESADVRGAAALALTAHPEEWVVPALIPILDDDDSMVRMLAVHALVAIGKPAVPALLESYQSSQLRGRIQCMRALAEIQDHRAIPLMMKSMSEDSAMLHYWAQEGIERLGLNMVYINPE